MPEGRPAVFSIPVYRSFADALANGLIAQFGADRMGLARGLILVPNNRAALAVTDAFVRRAGDGLLLPRIAPIGDAGELPGALLDGAGANLPPPVDPLLRRMVIARLVQEERAVARAPVGAAEAFRLADELAGALDELIAEEVAPARLRDLHVGPDLAGHWQKSLQLFSSVIDRWPEELAKLGALDLPDRRNRLLRGLARAWRDTPPDHFVVGAGITTAAPAVADLLRTIAYLPQGSVILPGLDLASPDEEWDAIGGDAEKRGIETHPQFQLRQLLDRIGVARAEVVRWRWGDGRPRKAVRGRAVSNCFAPARFTRKWIALPPEQRRLPGVRTATFANPAEEAQGIAIALREALETPERTAALVTPDRGLARRVAAHLRRWGIEADDSAGQPLAATPPGVLIQAVAQLALDRFAPVPLLAVLKHPLVRMGEGRAAWLDGARTLDRALRGPRPAPDIAGLTAWLAADAGRDTPRRLAALPWWTEVAPLFEALERAFAGTRPTLGQLLAALRETLDGIAGDAVWAGPAGRAAAELIAALESQHLHGPRDFTPDDLPQLLRQLMSDIAVRPPQGGHPRIFIWGLIEARLQQADLLILGGLNEGNWPAATVSDPWLSPRVRRELNIADPERRVGLAAHDLASALGARDVLMTRSVRDGRSATIASRFWLRIEAMTGGLAVDRRLQDLAVAIDAHQGPPEPASRPAPRPPVADRPRRISVTEVDRLNADPYAFYARSMLKLDAFDRVDADPGPAWRGSAVHAVLEKWMKEDKLHPGALLPRVEALLAEAGTHPLTRTLWQPRLVEAIEWIAAKIAENRAEGREPVESEIAGSAMIGGVELRGIADRFDRLADGRFAVVDYKTGKPPSTRAVAAGYSMQLGLLAAIAERGGFKDIAGKVGEFEYWTLARNRDGGLGEVKSPAGGRTGPGKDEFVAEAERAFVAAVARWLTGDEGFKAKLVPEYATYEDYDQLMRRDEWYGRDEA